MAHTTTHTENFHGAPQEVIDIARLAVPEAQIVMREFYGAVKLEPELLEANIAAVENLDSVEIVGHHMIPPQEVYSTGRVWREHIVVSMLIFDEDEDSPPWWVTVMAVYAPDLLRHELNFVQVYSDGSFVGCKDFSWGENVHLMSRQQ